MRIRLESLTIKRTHVHVIHTGNLQLETFIAVRLESIQMIEDVRGLVCVAGKVVPIHGDFKVGLGEGDGQLKLLVNGEGEATIALFCQPTAKDKRLAQF